MKYRYVALTAAGFLTTATAVGAQDTLTAADYQRAERFLRQNTASLVYGATVNPNWIDDDRFWYRNTVPGGAEFVLADIGPRRRARAFDHQRLAAGISRVTGETHGELTLPFTTFDFVDGGIEFRRQDQTYRCNLSSYQCTAVNRAGPDRNVVVSPDGRRAAFIRNHNLWVRDTGTNEAWQLTRDGVEDFGYATDNAGWVKRDRPVVRWSPDSRRIATFQHDARGVGNMYLVSTNVGHPELEAWKYPLPEDSVIFRIHRVIVDVDAARVTRLRMAPDQHRSTICDHISCGGTFSDVEWSDDATQLAFVSSSRDHKQAILRVADAETGSVRTILEENVDTFFESGARMVNWHVLPETNEVIWFSQRDNWGHLYLYDLETGNLKHQITSGNWNVLQLRHIDRDNRALYFMGSGREPGDPYFQYFYRVNMDGSGMTLLTPDSAHHTVSLSPDRRHFTDVWSTPTTPPRSVVRDVSGNAVLDLETADISSLVATGWQAPMPFTTKGRDGTTDLYGLLYRPTNFDPSRTYPIINYLYPGPQSGSVGSRSFSASRRDHQAIAELGFVVVEVDGMGTPGRSKSFHETYYGNMGDNTLPDQITTIRQLAARYPWMDLDRVGIWGHSGGGFASTAGILRYPDFYKVAVSQAGNHDNRNYEDDWGEKWQGLLTENPDGTTNYDNQANQLLAGNLQGKLLLAHGTMDDNVPPYMTLLVVDALIAANKDFDLIMFPNRRHGFGNEPYMMRRRWDYFVRHLAGNVPPVNYQIGERQNR